jgi:hypothetical protein
LPPAKKTAEGRDFIEEVPGCQTLLRVQASPQKKAQPLTLRSNPPKEEGGGDWARGAQQGGIIIPDLCGARII